MTAGLGRTLVETDVPCAECGRTTWSVGILAEPLEPDEPGQAFLRIGPAPMARCAACGNSQRLDDRGDASAGL